MRALVAIALALAACHGSHSPLDDAGHGKYGYSDPGGGFAPPTRITSGGAGGLSSVSHDTTLTGNGTGGSPLGVVTKGPNPYTGTFFEWDEEWLQRVSVTSTGTQLGIYDCLCSGTGCSGFTADANGGSGRPGIGLQALGTTTTGRAQCTTSLGAFLPKAGDVYTLSWIGGFSATSNSTDGYAFWVGFVDTATTVAIANGCYVLYDERQSMAAPTTGSRAAAGSQILNCGSASSSTRTEYPMDGTTVSDESFTTAATTVGAVTWPSTNALNLKIVWTVGTRCEFFVNGTKACDINTHLPTANVGAGFASLKSVGTTSVGPSFDFTSLSYTLAARSP